MEAPVLYIRADASAAMGTGHVMRCLALGQTFHSLGGRVCFMGCCDSPHLAARLDTEGFKRVDILPGDSAMNSLPGMLEITRGRGWLVLDGYHFDSDFHRAVRAAGHRLLVVDDYHHLPWYDADIILNQSAGSLDLNYNAPAGTRILSGFQFAMIRKEFLNCSEPEPDRSPRNRILVTLGGADPDNATQKVIAALENMDGIKVKVVVGPCNPHMAVLQERLKPGSNIEMVVNPDMPQLIRWADIAVTAAGTTCLELCHAGVPFVMIVTAENQKILAQSLAAENVGIHMGKMDGISKQKLAGTLLELIEDKEKRTTMAGLARKLVDGKGTLRIIREMERNRYSCLQTS